MLASIHSALDALRSIKRPSHNSTFRTTGELTPEEFVLAGDYLTFKFPTWQWSGGDASKRKDYFTDDKQFLVTKHVPCLRRLDENFAGGWEGGDEADREFEYDGENGNSGNGAGRAHGGKTVEKVQSVDDKGVVEEVSELESEDDIPDMEDDDDEEAIIRDTKRGGVAVTISATGRSGSGKGTTAPRRTYNLYIIYHPYYRTPCLYLSGYDGTTQLPLTPNQMMEDIMGDYKDKTVTVENFPHFEGNIQMASVHPCRHAGVMRGLLDRADAALKLRRKKQLAAKEAGADWPDVGELSLDGDKTSGVKPAASGATDEWEEVAAEDGQDGGEDGIRVDQYLVIFLKFMASVTPGIEHDFTMGL